MMFRSYRSSEKSDANFAKRGLNSKVRSRRFEKNPMIVPLQTAITSVPQFKPTNFPKKQKVMTVLASRYVSTRRGVCQERTAKNFGGLTISRKYAILLLYKSESRKIIA